ncbi:MAG: ABC transporter ATP-binding protein [Acidimicrobiia bacterium]
MLIVRDLSVGYYRDLLVLRDLNVEARAGITAILGANGVGKSTLLKAVYGFLRPQKGSIEFNGVDLVGTPPHRMVDAGLSYIPQQSSVFPHMTVEENLRMGAWTFKRDDRRVEEQLERNYVRFPVLKEKRKQRAGELSGGQQRMVEIGRGLMTAPHVFLIDEPTAGLAARLTGEVYEMLVALREEGLIILLVDQEIRSALKIADYVYVLDLGRNRFEGPPSEFEDLKKAFWSS